MHLPQMVNDHFAGPGAQRQLRSELARLGSDALLPAAGSAPARTASGQLDVTASTNDLAALSFA